MALLGKAAVAMWWHIAPAHRDEFQDWHSHEHFPERMGIPGFLRGSRWADAGGGPGFFVLYELDAYETLTSPQYLARLNQPTPWSVKMMPHHADMVRSQCRVLESWGGGIGRCVLTLRLSPRPGHADALRAGLRALLQPLPARRGITGAHLLQTQTPKADVTLEQKIRGERDAQADWIVLVQGYDAGTLHDLHCTMLDAQSLGEAGASPGQTGAIYDLSLAITPADLDRESLAPADSR